MLKQLILMFVTFIQLLIAIAHIVKVNVTWTWMGNRWVMKMQYLIFLTSKPDSKKYLVKFDLLIGPDCTSPYQCIDALFQL